MLIRLTLDPFITGPVSVFVPDILFFIFWKSYLEENLSKSTNKSFMRRTTAELHESGLVVKTATATTTTKTRSTIHSTL